MLQVPKTNNIILAVLIVLALNEVYKRVYPEDTITERDLKRELVLQKSQIKIDSWKTERANEKKIYETLEKSINVDSVIIWDLNRITRDSIREYINPK